MSIRTLLISLTLVFTGLVAPKLAQADTAPHLRHEQGVHVMEVQREGLRDILLLLKSMNRLAEKAALPGTTTGLRVQLDSRFQFLRYEIGQVAIASVHGVISLNAIQWIDVQVSPGSQREVTVHGLDAQPAVLGVADLYITDMFAAMHATQAIENARWPLLWGQQRNCMDLAALGVDADCGFTEESCRGAVNSSGAEGRLIGRGTLTPGQVDQLYLDAIDCPPGNLGWFLMGQGATDIPFGNGNLCISRGAGGLFRISQGTLIGGYGDAYLSLTDVDSAFSSLINFGSTWYFQFIFNDAAGAGMNSTSALRVTFES